METDRTHLFDLRTVERNIKKGIVTREEYDAFLAAMDEDCASSSEVANTRLVHRARHRMSDVVGDDGE